MEQGKTHQLKIACLQMEVAFCDPDENFARAGEMIAQAMEQSPDVLLLPETWNTGFFPQEDLEALCDQDGQRVCREIGALAKQYHVNIVAGSVSNLRGGKIYNTAMVFDRSGSCIAQYDKTHLFTPAGEDRFYTPGEQLCTFTLDGVRCGMVVCYDIRFPELSRTLAVAGMEVLFVSAQWLRQRIDHLRSLSVARAIENQVYVACCNACGTAGETVYSGSSAIISPRGETLAQAGEVPQILTAPCPMQTLQDIRSAIPVFRDRRPELYQTVCAAADDL